MKVGADLMCPPAFKDFRQVLRTILQKITPF